MFETLKESDYLLPEGVGVWIEVGQYAIRLRANADGTVSVGAYINGCEMAPPVLDERLPKSPRD